MYVNQYIIESCEIQNATNPIDFVSFARAYERLLGYEFIADRYASHREVLESMTLTLSKLTTGYGNYRMQAVTFEDGSMGAPWREVPRLMKQLLDAQTAMTPEEFYQEFERIHPFQDGNGRVGSLLYNFLKGTLETPEHPPAYTGKI